MGEASKPGLRDEKAARMMVALRAGKTLRKFCVKARRLELYFKTNPEYAREARPLIIANSKAANLRKGAHNSSKTHCIHGHTLVDARVFYQNGWIKRDCRTCWQIRSKLGGVIRPDVLEKVTAALKGGATIGSLTVAGGSTYLVMHSTFSRYRRENPEFDKFVIGATKDNNSKGQKLRSQRAHNARVRNEHNDYYKIVALMPANLPPDICDDIAHSTFVALLEGSLQRDQVKSRIQGFLAAHNRDANKHGTGKYGLRSIDAPAFAEGSMTLGDTISRGLWD
jgi:hypothetical protein